MSVLIGSFELCCQTSDQNIKTIEDKTGSDANSVPIVSIMNVMVTLL